MLNNSKQKGSALLTALFIMTLVAIVVTAMSTRVQLDIYRTRLLLTYDQLYLSSQMLTFWSLDQLKEKKFQKANDQGLVSSYPKKNSQITPKIQITGGLYDLQALFNLNNLTQKSFAVGLTNLLSQSSFKLPKEEQVKLDLALKDWLSTYDLSKGKDQFMEFYLAQKPPYYPSHQLMSSISELRLVQGVNASLYLALEPFITTLPETTPINLNTVSKTVLQTLGSGLNEEQVNEIISARGDKGIKKIQDISELIKKMNLSAEQITLESQYFLSVAHVHSEEFQLGVYTLLKRKKDKNEKVIVSVLSERISG